MITSLKAKPFSALGNLANRYKEISPHVFGSMVCEWNGTPALTARPLEDLALLICFPDRQKPENPWPPSAPLWEAALRYELLELSVAMRDWAGNFRDSKGGPHWRIIDVGLETMRTWLGEPASATCNHWWGTTELISHSLSLEPVNLTLEIGCWDPLGETEEAFHGRVKAATDELKRWAKDQIPEIKKLLVSFDTKRNPEHFHWAALRLVRKLTYPQIAEMWGNMKPEPADLDEGTVRKGVQATLKALGLQDLTAKRK